MGVGRGKFKVTPGDGIQRCNTDVFPVPTVSEPDLRAPADERPFGAATQVDEKQRTLEEEAVAAWLRSEVNNSL